MRTAASRWLGEAYLLRGRLDEAQRVRRARARRSPASAGERGNEAWALRLLGEIAAHRRPLRRRARPRPTTARRSPSPSELGMRPLVAHCHLGLGKLYRRTGKREQAQEHLTTATTMYREMDMTFWLEKAEAEMRELA